MKSKRELLGNLLSDKLRLLRCPICDGGIIMDNNCLICENHHAFDISKKGVILLHRKYLKKEDEIYTKNLFVHRREFILGGYYSEVYDYISTILDGYNPSNQLSILDLGSGECSHLKIVKGNKNYIAVGVDLSYDAISMATDYICEGIIPICGDLYNLPFEDCVFDYIINFLSPINTNETCRVLKDNGFIIKVIPTPNYLIELRKELGYDEYDKGDMVIGNLGNKFEIVNIKRIENTKKVDSLAVSHLFYMTPLTNHLTSKIPQLSEITISLDIVIMKKLSN